MQAAITGIEYYLPEQVLTNEDLSKRFPGWSPEKIVQKVGIEVRHIAEQGECASDLGVIAAHKLFAEGVCRRQDVDYLIFCTQSPDYFLPTTACQIQDRLGLSHSAGAVDINLGCSGFVYGLGLAKGLIETDQARCVLLITADTYSKYLNENDRGARILFGDGAAATLVQAVPESRVEGSWLGPFVWGTDGRGSKNLIVRAGGMRHLAESAAGQFFMDGPEIFNFTLKAVPEAVDKLLQKAGRVIEEVDLFVFHQANQYMLEHLRQKLNIPEQKFVLALQDCGNTVSSSIPIALKQALSAGRIISGQQLMLVGFGVGYSWAAGMIHWYSPLREGVRDFLLSDYKPK